MDQSAKRLEDDETPTMKTVKCAGVGLAAGSISGAVVANLYDTPKVGNNVARLGLIRTLKGCGYCGLTFAALGGIYIGVEQLQLKHRMKRDFVNGAVGAFVAGASVLGFKAPKQKELVYPRKQKSHNQTEFCPSSRHCHESAPVVQPAETHTGKRTCAQHPIGNFVSYDQLSPSYKAFTTTLTETQIPKTIQEALSQEKWNKAGMKGVQALERNQTWEDCAEFRKIVEKLYKPTQ